MTLLPGGSVHLAPVGFTLRVRVVGTEQVRASEPRTSLHVLRDGHDCYLDRECDDEDGSNPEQKFLLSCRKMAELRMATTHAQRVT